MARASSSLAKAPLPFKILSEELVVVKSAYAELTIHFNYQQTVPPGKEYLLRMVIRAETYHSKAVVESWDGNQWHNLVYIHQAKMAIEKQISYYPEPEKRIAETKAFNTDMLSLFQRVKTILR
jgi:hypothetical protein